MDSYRTYLYSCQLYLDSLQINKSGNYYFAWYKGKRHTQSSKYSFDQYSYEQPIQFNQTLKMNLKLYSHKNRNNQEQFQQKNTHLYLLDARTDQQICGFSIKVQAWGESDQKASLEIHQKGVKGLLQISFKKTLILQLDGFQRFSGQLEQSEGQDIDLKHSLRYNEGMSAQLIRLQKQLQDNCYLVQKLKKDRNTVLTHNQKLQKEIRSIKKHIKEQIKKMQEHYIAKQQIRESIYRQQIQQLISTFNKNSVINQELMKSIVEENQNLYLQLEETKCHYDRVLQQQRSYFDNKQQQFENQKISQAVNIRQLKQKVQELHHSQIMLKNSIIQQQNTKKVLQSRKNETQQVYENKLSELQQTTNHLDQQISQLQTKVSKLQQEVSQKNSTILEHQRNQYELRTKLQLKQNELSQEKMRRQDAEQNIKILRSQIQNLNSLNQAIKVDNDRIQEQNQKNMNEMRNFYEITSKNNAQDLNRLTQQIQTLQQQNTVLLNENSDIKNTLIIKQQQINSLRTDLDLTTQKYQINLNEIVSTYDADANDLKQKINEQQLTIQAMKFENQKLEMLLKSQQQKFLSQTEILQKQYDLYTANREEEYQKQMQQFKDQMQSAELHYSTKLLDQQKQNQLLQIQLEGIKQEADQRIQDLQQTISKRQHQIKQLVDQKFRLQLQRNNQQNNFLSLQPHKNIDGDIEHKKYIQEMEHFKQLMKYQQQRNNKQKLQLQEQWNSIKIAHQQLLEKQEKLRSGILNKQTTTLDKPSNNLLTIPKPNKSSQQSLQYNIPSKSMIKYQNKHNKQIKQSFRQLKDQFRQMSFNSRQEELDEHRQIFMQRINQLQKQCIEFEEIKNQKDNQINYLQKQIQNLNKELEQLFIEKQQMQLRYKQQQQEVKLKFEEYDQYINELQAKVDMANISNLSKRPSSYHNQSNLQIREHSISLERQKSDKQLQTSFKSIIRKPPSIKQPILQQIAIQTQHDSKKTQQISFHDLKLTSSIENQSSVLESQRLRSSINKKKGLQIKEGIKEQIMESGKFQQQLQRVKPDMNSGLVESANFTPVQSNDNQILLRQQNTKLRNLEQKMSTKIQNISSELRLQEQKMEILEKQKYLLSKSKNELQIRNQQLFDEITLLKKQLQYKSEMHDSKLIQIEQQLQLQTKKSIIQTEQKADKLKKQLQHQQEHYKQIIKWKAQQIQKLLYQNQQYRTDIQRIKNDLQNAQKRQLTPQNSFDFTKTLQNQLQDTNRKILQLTRSLNQLKIERDSFEDQIIAVRKKLTNAQKIGQQKYHKINQLEREYDELMRKSNKYKRQNQNKQQQIRKQQQKIKKQQQQLQSYNNYNSNSYLQKKKVIDQKLQLQQELSRKNMEMRKMEKQIRKIKQELEESTNNNLDRKSVKEKQYERNMIELHNNKKIIIQYEQENHRLTNRVVNLQNYQKQQLQNIRRSHSQKLKYYINEISNIKSLKDESQAQIHNLRMQNQNLQEQVHILQQQLQKSQQKMNQLIQFLNQAEKALQIFKHQKSEYTKTIQTIQEDLTGTHNQIAKLNERLQKQQMVSLKKSEKVEEYQIMNQKYIYEIKNLKVKLNQYETKTDITKSLSQRLAQQQNYTQNLVQEVAKITRNYNQYKSQYKYTAQQVESQMQNMKNQCEQQINEQITSIKHQLQEQYQNKTATMQQQILKLYNQNARFGINLQQKDDQIAQSFHKLKQIQPFIQKYKNCQRQLQILSNKYITNQNQLKVLQKQIQHLQSVNQQKQRIMQQQFNDKQLRQQSFKQLQSQYHKIKRQKQQLEAIHQLLTNQYNNIKKVSNRTTEESIQQIQKLNSKVLSMQLENQRIKQREINLNKSYKIKITTLENTLKQLTTQRKSIENTLQNQLIQQKQQNINTIKYLQQQVQKYKQNSKIQQKSIHQLTQQTSQLRIELGDLRQQQAQDQDIYILEINNLKNAMKDMEQLYNLNIQNLQEQLAVLNRQLTNERINKNQIMRGSRLRQSQVDDRYEQKLRMRDNKIEQLKNQIFLLQQKYANFHHQNQMEQLTGKDKPQKFKNMYIQINKKLEEAYAQIQTQRQKAQQSTKIFKKQLIQQKQEKQNLQMSLQQKNLLIQSIQIQLKTIKQLYGALQLQIQKRKDNIGCDIQIRDVLRKQLDYANTRLLQLQTQCNQNGTKIEQLSTKLHNKQQQLLITSQQLHKLKIQTNKTAKNYKQTISWQQKQKEHIMKMQENLQILQKQNRKHLIENSALKEQILFANQTRQNIQNQLTQLQDINRKLSMQLQAKSSKLQEINNKCRQKHGYSAQQFILDGIMTHKLIQQDQALQLMQQELQQVKFLEDQKLMDYQDLKRQKFQLQLKLEDYDELIERINILQDNCDRLEQEKKIIMFRQEAVRVRLANTLDNNNQNSMRESITAILDNDHIHD